MDLDKLRSLCVSEHQKIAVDNCIALLRVGSHLYGTNSPQSDDDFVGIFIQPKEYKIGRKHLEFVEFKSNSSSSGHRNEKGDLDCTMYSLDKWIGLLENNNPNQLEILFVNKPNILYSTPAFHAILDKKAMFVSKKTKHSFSGYAYSQIHRSEIKSGNQTGRKDLIAKFGFDPKLCSHAIRLYSECLDLLVREEISFPLSNNVELLDLKRGDVSYEKFQERCKFYEPLIEKAYIESKLRNSPDHEGIHNLQIQLYESHWY